MFRLPVCIRACDSRARLSERDALRAGLTYLGVLASQEGFFKLPPNFRKYSKFISYGWG